METMFVTACEKLYKRLLEFEELSALPIRPEEIISEIRNNAWKEEKAFVVEKLEYFIERTQELVDGQQNYSENLVHAPMLIDEFETSVSIEDFPISENFRTIIKQCIADGT